MPLLPYLLSALLVLTNPALVWGTEYTGQELRDIKSLSKQDIDDIKQGRGWGLAKPAELNGLPGPIHLLELREALKLSDGQVEKIESLYVAMNLTAKKIGERYIEQEKAIEHILKQREVPEQALVSAVHKANATLAELRLAHLKAHLATPALLTEKQLEKYQFLRGYSNSDLCNNPPAGHDADMWKRHNNCD